MAKKKKEPQAKRIERKVYYYKVGCKCDGITVPISNLFDLYMQLYNDDGNDLEERGLVVPFYDKYHFLEISKHEYDKDIYQGKFYSLRSTDFPYLFNLSNGSRQEIEAGDNDTLMEQTHFCYIVSSNIIVSEYNFHGARIERLSDYLLSIMARTTPSKSYEISIDPIIMPDYYTRIVNCQSLSKLQFKVARPGLKLLKEHKVINSYDVFTGDIDADTDFYVDVIISGSKRGGRVPVANLPEFLQRIVNAIRAAREKDSKAADGSKPTFSKAHLRGFDADVGKTIPYDLLDEKLVQTELVEKISNRSKYVDSHKMFAALAKAYRDKKDIALMYMEQMQR